MVITCCISGCYNRPTDDSSLSFHRLPKDLERKRLWVAAIRRKNWDPSPNSRVCGRHFISGKKSDLPFNPDFVPSLHLGYDKQDVSPVVKTKRFERRIQREERHLDQENRTHVAKALLELSDIHNRDDSFDISTSTESTSADLESLLSPHIDIHDACLKKITELKLENKQLQQELARLQTERDDLGNTINKVKFGVKTSENNDSRVSFFTGLPSFAVFSWLLTFLVSVLPKSQCLDPGNVLLLILMKLKVNLFNQDLAVRFFVSEAHVSDLLS